MTPTKSPSNKTICHDCHAKTFVPNSYRKSIPFFVPSTLTRLEALILFFFSLLTSAVKAPQILKPYHRIAISHYYFNVN